MISEIYLSFQVKIIILGCKYYLKVRFFHVKLSLKAEFALISYNPATHHPPGKYNIQHNMIVYQITLLGY